MAAQQAPLVHRTTIKVTIGDDTRRICLALPKSACASSPECEEMFVAICNVVADGYSIPAASLPTLKYRDEDGDLCTLAPCTVPDLLCISKGGPLRLVGAANVAASHAAEVPQQERRQSQPDASVEEIVSTSASADVVEAAAHPAAPRSQCEYVAEEPLASAEDDEPAPAATVLPEAVESLQRLVEMGFPEDKARRALLACKGNEGQAVDSLLNGDYDAPFLGMSSSEDLLSGFQCLLLQVRSRLSEVRDQLQPLREAAGRHWERRREHRDRAQEEGRRRLKQLQESIAELRVKLREMSKEFEGSAHGAAEKVNFEKICQDEVQLRFEKLCAQLEDAHQFLGDTLTAVHGRASGILQRVFNPASNTEATSEAEQNVAAVSAAETAEAVAKASENAALAAIDTVDEFLVGMGHLPESDASPRMRQMSQGAAQAQQFFAKTFARLHGKASEILMAAANSTGDSTGEAEIADPISRATDVETSPQEKTAADAAPRLEDWIDSDGTTTATSARGETEEAEIEIAVADAPVVETHSASVIRESLADAVPLEDEFVVISAEPNLSADS